MIDYSRLERAIKNWTSNTNGFVTENAVKYWANQVGGSYAEQDIIQAIDYLAGRKLQPHLDKLKDILEHGVPTEKKFLKKFAEEEIDQPEIPHLTLEDKEWNIQFDRKWKNIMAMLSDKDRNKHILNILVKEGMERAFHVNDKEAIQLWQEYKIELEEKLGNETPENIQGLGSERSVETSDDMVKLSD